jgi:predicted phosphate transport protein (TIGR00153 family)
MRLIPTDEKFHELFIAHGERVQEAANKLEAMTASYTNVQEQVAAIRAVEKEGDKIVGEVHRRLERSFITPYDRADIHDLTSYLDNILDGIQAAAETFVIYGINAPTDEAKEFTSILSAQASQLVEALGKLSTHTGIAPHLATINDLEHRADGLSRSSVGRLFRESTDAIEVIKLRDLYQQLEEAVDAAQDAGKVISRILAKHH